MRAALLVLKGKRMEADINTIAAIATPLSPSGISIVRISGPEAISVADRIFRFPKIGETLAEKPSHTIHYGHIYDGDKIVDEVLVMLMRSPRSYTTEDTVEIDCHGGILVTRTVLDLACKNGARLAQPGEFTKMAFLGGRIDLSQAEAVMELIEAKNRYALQSSLNQLNGLVSGKIRSCREEILYEMAYLESALDDPEHISLDGFRENLICKVRKWKNLCSELGSHFTDGRLAREGIKTVILGRPNVGKSSLMNIIMGEERAIVTEVAGTTRDTLEESLFFRNISMNLVDTAGIRDTDDTVEKIGVGRARRKAEEADLILYVVDGSQTLEEADYEIMNLIRNRQAIVVLNKNDLETVMLPRELHFLTGKKVVSFSARTGEGLDELGEEIQNMFFSGLLEQKDDLYMANARHKEALDQAFHSLELVEEAITDGMPEDLFSIDMMDAYQSLGRILGESVEEDLINEIFGKFCMGK